MSTAKTNFGYGRFNCFVIKTTALSQGSKYDTDFDYKINGVVIRSKNSYDQFQILSVSSKAGSVERFQLDARTYVIEGCTGQCRLLLSFFLRRYLIRNLDLGIVKNDLRIIY